MKKAFLSIATLLSLVTISGCGEQVSSVGSSTSSEGTTSEGITSSSSSVDVYTYSLSVLAPTKTVFEVGEVLDFSTVEVKEETFVNGNSKGEVLLTREQYIVKVNNQVIDGNFTFSSEGTVEFVISSKEHEEASNSFSVNVVQYFTITNASSDKVVLTSLPTRSLANETITFGLTLLPGYYFEGTLSIFDGASNPVTYTEENYQYTFTMPASNVTISVISDLNDFTIAKDNEIIGDVVLESGDDTSDVFSATPGTRLKFKASESVDFTFTEIYIDGTLLEKGDDDFYHFEMPHHPVTLTTNKSPRYYSINTNLNELEISQSVMYVEDSSTPITSAYKGQRVYLSFTYEVTLVKYEISVKDKQGNALEVKQVEGQNIFYFDMISSEITISVKEDDWSKYYGYYVTNKTWKTWSVSSYTTELVSKKGNEISGPAFVFNSNGKGTRGTIGFTWNADYDSAYGELTLSNIDRASVSVTKEVYYTEHLMISKMYDTTSAKWEDAYVGTWDDETTVNVFVFNSRSRLIWASDENGNIIEQFLIHDEEVFETVYLYKDEELTDECLSGDITKDSTFYVYVDDDLTFGVEKGTIVRSYKINKEESSQYTIITKNESGEEITTAKNGQKVYIYGTLASGISSDITIDSPIVLNDSSSVYVKKETGDNVWSFTMPTGEVTVSLNLNDPNKFKGYEAVGKYIGVNIWGSGDKTLKANDSNTKKYEITLAGKFNNNGTMENISSLDNSSYGKMIANKEWNFGNDVIASPTSYKKGDAYVAFKIDDDFDLSSHTVTAQVHYIGSYYYGNSTFAVEFIVDGEFKAGVFMTNDTYYCGVTFTYENTTRVGSTGTYHVVYQGQTIFDVTGSTVTAHE